MFGISLFTHKLVLPNCVSSSCRVQEAKRAVGNIKPESLTEIRSLRAPPETVRDILEGVLRLMGTFDTSWNSMKT